MILAWVFACALAGASLISWRVAIRAREPGASTPGAGSMLDAPIALGAALGAMAAVPVGSEAPWIASGAMFTIPVAAGAAAIGWVMIRARAATRWPADGFLLAMLLVGMGVGAVVLTGGVGLAEGAAIGLALGACAWMRVPRGGQMPGTGAVVVLVWALLLFGVPALWFGAPPAMVWGITLAGLVGALAVPRAADARMASMVVVVAPASAIAVATVVRVILAAVDAGAAAQALGAPWWVGVVEMAAARPTAELPRGLAPEWCGAVAALGMAWCAPRVPAAVRVVLGAGVMAIAAVVAVVALAS